MMRTEYRPGVSSRDKKQVSAGYSLWVLGLVTGKTIHVMAGHHLWSQSVLRATKHSQEPGAVERAKQVKALSIHTIPGVWDAFQRMRAL